MSQVHLILKDSLGFEWVNVQTTKSKAEKIIRQYKKISQVQFAYEESAMVYFEAVCEEAA